MRKMIPGMLLTAGLAVGLAIPTLPTIEMGKPTQAPPPKVMPQAGSDLDVTYAADLATIEAQFAIDMAAAGFEATEDIVGPDGTVHTNCWIYVGDTSMFQCSDGFSEES